MTIRPRLTTALLFLALAIGYSPRSSEPVKADGPAISGRYVDHKQQPLENVGIWYNREGQIFHIVTNGNGEAVLPITPTSSVEEPDYTEGGNGEPPTPTGGIGCAPGCQGGVERILLPEDMRTDVTGRAYTMSMTQPDSFTVNPDTLYVDGWWSRGESPKVWSARVPLTLEEALQSPTINGALPYFTETIPNGRELTGPEEVNVNPEEFIDYFDDFSSEECDPTLWHPGSLPVLTGNDQSNPFPQEEYNAIVSAAQTWELLRFGETGVIYNFLPWNQSVTGDSYIKLRETPGWPSTSHFEDNGYIVRAVVELNSGYGDEFTWHELSWRCFQNGGWEVTSYYPTVGHNTSPDLDEKDPAYMNIEYDLQDVTIAGGNDFEEPMYTTNLSQ
ncbi:MAG: hypothetical protein KKG59_02725 [Nanoarchaeota archaeon]|nr:hypothetical protein [Nanoarchaeota archaeon]MBU1975297.1 hypothetical protein [Nanoarchaeota archaeon]